jgi:hypothetical protein
MIDTEKEYVDDTQEETTQQDDTQPQEEVVEEEQIDASAQEQPDEQKAAETTQQKNFRLARESLDREKQERMRAERERDEAFNILRDLERRALEAKAPKPSAEEEFLDDDAKKLHREIQELKKMQQRQNQQSYQDQVERRLRKEYPEFDRLMTEENIANFARSNPRRASILQKETDLYLQAAETIEGILEMQSRQAPYSQDRNKMLQNAKKPKTTSPVPGQSSSPLVNLANGGHITSTDLDRIREVTQNYINNKRIE